MSTMATLARAAAVLAAVASLAGCAASTPAQTPGQALRGRLAAFVGAHALILDGTVALDSTTYQVTLSEDGSGQAQGTVTLDHQGVTVDWSGGQLFLKSGDYFQSQKLAVGTRWVLTHGDKLQPVVAKLANRKELAAAIVAMAGGSVTQRAGQTTNGVHTVQLSSDMVTVTVPQGSGAPVRLATAVDQPLSDGLSDLKLSVSVVASALAVTPPPSPYVDLANLDTLPANYTESAVNTFQFQPCDDGGCTLSEDFTNTGGRVGAATATFFVVKEGSSDRLASCSTSIPPAGHGETVHAGCRVTWDTSLNVEGSADIANPA